jgi:hypothetical protein
MCLRAHVHALDPAVHTEATLITPIIPSVSFHILHTLVDAGLGDVLAFPDRTTFPVGHTSHRLAPIRPGWGKGRRASLSTVHFTRTAVAS